MHQIPETGYLREKQILGNKKSNPPIPAIIPISRSSWWNGVKSGRYPAPIKLGPRTTVWTVASIRALIENPKAFKPGEKQEQPEQLKRATDHRRKITAAELADQV